MYIDIYLRFPLVRHLAKNGRFSVCLIAQMGPFLLVESLFLYLQIFRQIMASYNSSRTWNSFAKWMQINRVYNVGNGTCHYVFVTRNGHLCLQGNDRGWL